MTVDHIDGDKDNNHISNLQLLLSADNVIKAKARYWSIRSPDGEVHEIYNLCKFARENGLNRGHLSERKHSKGWVLL